MFWYFIRATLKKYLHCQSTLYILWAMNNNLLKIQMTRCKLLNGELTYDEAKNILQPVITDMNTKTKMITKKHNKKLSPISFTGLMR